MENNRYREEELENEKEQEQETEIVNEQPTEDVKEVKQSKKDKKLNKKIEELELLNEELNAKLQNCQNEMLKDRAELENFKRRTNEERIKDRKYALQEFLTDLIEVVDIFDRAVRVTTDDEKLKKYLVGFSMINTQIQQLLENYGVKKIEALNKPFDPTIHAAIETIEKEGIEAGIVVEEVVTGYMYKDRVLRPSMVKVSA
ncbi:MAG: nucleotide exchange factor GrpE [Bacilli bacterium]|nr:nucleotide exchange factor GrpE [Bacilli bacterium]